MPVSVNDEMEICPICHDEFHKDEIVYRPLLNGEIGKPYHEKCLLKHCKEKDECVDPVTRIMFSLKSKIECRYSQVYVITLTIKRNGKDEKEKILLGTEPCDRFHEIRKFMSINHNIPIESRLYRIEGGNRIPVVYEQTITNDDELELVVSSPEVDSIPLGALFDGNSPIGTQRSIKNLQDDLEKIKSAQKDARLSDKQITEAATAAVEVEGTHLSPLTPGNIIQIDAQIREIDHTLSELPPNDPKRAPLESKYKKLLITGTLMLYEQVKGSISGFLSGSVDFATDPETREQLLQFVSYVFRLVAMGVYNIFYLIAVLGWKICKLIPKIIEYVRSVKNEEDSPSPEEEDPPSPPEEEKKEEGFFSRLFRGNDDDPDPSGPPLGGSRRIRQRDAPIVQTMREAGVVEENIPYGLRKGEEYEPGLMFTPRYI